MLLSRLFSPGKSLWVNSFTKRSVSLRCADPSTPTSVPVSLSSSLIYPELVVFDRIISQIENPNSSHFEVFQGPIKLRQKLVTRALLTSYPGMSADKSQVTLAHLKSFMYADFPDEFKNLLQEEKRLFKSDLSAYIESLRTRMDTLESYFQAESRQSKSRTVWYYFLFNLLLMSGLFYMTYFVYDWEVVEPISYLLVVSSNLLCLLMWIKRKRVTGHQLNMLAIPHFNNLASHRANYSFNRKIFFRFFYEYRELVRRLG